MYVQDYDECIPPYYRSGERGPELPDLGSRTTIYWQDLIYPYTKNFGIWVCPSSEEQSGNDAYLNSYGGNYRYIFSHYDDWVYFLADFERPAERYAVVEADSYITRYDPGIPSSHGGYWGLVQSRHNDQNNVLFIDGHAKSLADSVVSPQSPAWTGNWD